jgi:hypothetical protein
LAFAYLNHVAYALLSVAQARQESHPDGTPWSGAQRHMLERIDAWKAENPLDEILGAGWND